MREYGHLHLMISQYDFWGICDAIDDSKIVADILYALEQLPQRGVAFGLIQAKVSNCQICIQGIADAVTRGGQIFQKILCVVFRYTWHRRHPLR